ncbi:hypothetical protein RHODGE_RHODGE_02322 [Rhodoplanes serenus]|uniref:SnoaL-like domain-containing protein n=1 Tax=Rhodoplanes serenus TaxID=200615 RepID=A0A3S4B136_9BRAD|nr:nuclear transport factor 2 family protein [Rhodoplanes serenus]VCU09148.1 hypothetical protein RHODGE_RHODGE_02322 [Rhodoplanes serenus]
MLFYVQMKWNYQGRISQDQLWDMEALEGDHGVAGIRAGFVQLYKVVSQHRIIAIVKADSLDDLDRNSMGWLPMREYLEFEQVWALRDYEGFLADVKAKFPPPGQQQAPRPAAPVDPAETREIASAWFHNMNAGKYDDAIALLDPNVLWINVPVVPGVNDLVPWLGTLHGVEAVTKSFGVLAAHSKIIRFELIDDLLVSGDRAVGIIHEHSQCLSNGNEYDLEVATFLTVRNRKITQWRVEWDPSPFLRAYRNL